MFFPIIILYFLKKMYCSLIIFSVLFLDFDIKFYFTAFQVLYIFWHNPNKLRHNDSSSTFMFLRESHSKHFQISEIISDLMLLS